MNSTSDRSTSRTRSLLYCLSLNFCGQSISSTVCRKLTDMLELEKSHRPQPHAHLGKDNVLKVLPRFDHKYSILAGRKHLLSKNGNELECGCLPHLSVCSWKDPLKWLAHEPEIWNGFMVPYSMRKDKEFA